MGQAHKFEDLIVWQKARLLTKLIYQVTRQSSFASDLGLRSQMQRATVSIMSNLAEGFEHGSKAELHRFIVIAKASCAELRSHLYVALDCGFISEIKFKELITLSDEVGKMLGGFKMAVAKQIRN